MEEDESLTECWIAISLGAMKKASLVRFFISLCGCFTVFIQPQLSEAHPPTDFSSIFFDGTSYVLHQEQSNVSGGLPKKGPTALKRLEEFYARSLWNTVQITGPPGDFSYSRIWAVALNGRQLAITAITAKNAGVIDLWQIEEDSENGQRVNKLVFQKTVQTFSPSKISRTVSWQGGQLVLKIGDVDSVMAPYGLDTLLAPTSLCKSMIQLFLGAEGKVVEILNLEGSFSRARSVALNAVWAVVGLDSGSVAVIHRPTLKFARLKTEKGAPYAVQGVWLDNQNGLITITQTGLAEVWDLGYNGKEVRTALRNQARLLQEPDLKGDKPNRFKDVQMSLTPEGQFCVIGLEKYNRIALHVACKWDSKLATYRAADGWSVPDTSQPRILQNSNLEEKTGASHPFPVDLTDSSEMASAQLRQENARLQAELLKAQQIAQAASALHQQIHSAKTQAKIALEREEEAKRQAQMKIQDAEQLRNQATEQATALHSLLQETETLREQSESQRKEEWKKAQTLQQQLWENENERRTLAEQVQLVLRQKLHIEDEFKNTVGNLRIEQKNNQDRLLKEQQELTSLNRALLEEQDRLTQEQANLRGQIESAQAASEKNATENSAMTYVSTISLDPLESTPVALVCGHVFNSNEVDALYESNNPECPNCRNPIIKTQTRKLFLMQDQ